MGPNEMLHRYQQADKWLKTGVSGFSEAMIENDMVYPYWSGDSSFFWYQKLNLKKTIRITIIKI